VKVVSLQPGNPAECLGAQAGDGRAVEQERHLAEIDSRVIGADLPVRAGYALEDGEPAAEQEEEGRELALSNQPIAGIQGQVRRPGGDRIHLLGWKVGQQGHGAEVFAGDHGGNLARVGTLVNSPPGT
jgi:hypothetical protein